MDNQLKEFEELFIDNALLKVYNQTWRIKPKMEGMMANGIGITKEHIQNNLEIVHGNEKVYLNELVVYRLQLDGYTYDWLIGKPIKVSDIISYKFSLVQASIVATSFQSEHVVTTTKEPKPIKGVELAIISCTLYLPIEYVEVPIVTISTQVEGLEKSITPNPYH